MSTCANQNSIISYVPPFLHRAESSICGTVDKGGWTEVRNPSGMFNPDLSDKTVFAVSSGSVSYRAFTIEAQLDDTFLDSASALDNPPTLTVALIGCTLKSFHGPSGDPDRETVREHPIFYIIQTDGLTNTTQPDESRGISFNSMNSITTFCDSRLPGIASGGACNLVFSGHGYFDSNGSVSITVYVSGDSTSGSWGPTNVEFEVGHIFIGYEIPVVIDPDSFSWVAGIRHQRFLSRDFGNKSSNGALVRAASVDLLRVPFERMVATQIGDPGGSVFALHNTPNFFDMVKANNSYPLLFLPYRADILTALDPSPSEAEKIGIQEVVRQNFFSVYGMMTEPLEFRTDRFRDGLSTEYRARFSIEETR